MCGNVQTANGTVQIIDTVLMPWLRTPSGAGGEGPELRLRALVAPDAVAAR